MAQKTLPKVTGSYTAISALAPTVLDVDSEEFTPDAHIIATQIVYQGKRKNVAVPMNPHDLATSITSIAVDHTRSGAPSLVLTMTDPQWSILDSNFFRADDTGKLLDIDINYPDQSRFNWRLHQFSPQGSSRAIQLTFLPRAVCKLMGLFGPVQVDRASRTRAEFLKSLCAKVPEIEFYCKELDQKQPIAKPVTSGGLSITPMMPVGNASVFAQTNGNTSNKSSSKSPDGKAAKTKGVGANSNNLTVAGKRMNPTQVKFANMILQQGDSMSAPQAALEACVFSAIAESTMGIGMGWDGNNPRYGGLLAGDIHNFGHFGAASSTAVAAAEITSYFQGGLGYGEGAIKLSKQYQDIGQLAVRTAGAILPDGTFGPNGYGQYGQEHETVVQMTAEAKAIVQGGGGSGGAASFDTTEKVAQPYYFQVKQGEDYWSAMCRLAQEVGWELIVDGSRIYYDSDKVLITQKVAAVIDREDPTTLDWSYDWENRHIATNFHLNLVADPFEFTAGEVLQVSGFGVATTGSTAKPPLPGRWLIDEITHTKGDMFSVVSLVQPLPAKPEPAPQFTSVTVPGAAGGTTGSGTAVGGFADPFPDGWVPGRLDMGYDGTFKNRIVAPFDGYICYATGVNSPFSNWGGFIVLQSAKDIGLPTKTLYFAEGLNPSVPTGPVKAGQQIATAATFPGQGNKLGLIEFGVGMEAHSLGPVDPYGKQLGGSTSATDASRKMVLNFAQWCQDKLGLSAPATTGDAGHF
jgi:hypothetical protein